MESQAKQQQSIFPEAEESVFQEAISAKMSPTEPPSTASVHEILEKIPDLNQVDLVDLTDENVTILKSLVEKGYATEVLEILPAQINPDTIAHKHNPVLRIDSKIGLLLQSLVKKGYDQEILDRLPVKIELIHMAYSTMKLLRSLVKEGHGQEILKKIFSQTTYLNLKNLSAVACSFLIFLVYAGHEQEVSKQILTQTPQLDLDNLSAKGGLLLQSLVKKGYSQEILNKLPAKIELSYLNDRIIELLRFLVEEGYEQEIYKKLLTQTTQLDLDNLSTEGGLLLQSLVEKGYSQKILNKIPDQINLNKLSLGSIFLFFSFIMRGDSQKIFDKLSLQEKLGDLNNLSSNAKDLLKLLIKKGHGQEICNMLQGQVELDNLNRNAGLIYTWLVNDDFGQIVLNKLPAQIELNTLNIESIFLIRSLVDAGFSKQILAKLPENTDLNNLSYVSSRILEPLTEKGYEQEVLKKISGRINLNTLTPENANFLELLIDMTDGLKILDKLPNQIELNNLNSNAALLLQSLVKKGYAQEIQEKLSEEIRLDHMNLDTIDLLVLLSKSLENNEFINKILEQTESLTRKPINGNKLETFTERKNQSLSDIIEKFPIDEKSIDEWRGGWRRAKLRKTGTETDVFYKTINGEIKIVFYNYKIDQASLESYKKAYRLIPEFVSAPTYLELLESEDQYPEPSFRNNGFREVYAGYSFRDINLANLPEIIQNSIQLQRKYIILSLASNNIIHSHLHEGNFNVRFLLTTDDGQKRIIFDVNRAIELAKNDGYLLTPIVTLRDWDQARS